MSCTPIRASSPNPPPRHAAAPLLIRLVDALHDCAAIGDALWTALRREFEEAQLIDLIVLTGFYHMVSLATNGLHLPLEDGAARFPCAEP